MFIRYNFFNRRFIGAVTGVPFLLSSLLVFAEARFRIRLVKGLVRLLLGTIRTLIGCLIALPIKYRFERIHYGVFPPEAQPVINVKVYDNRGSC